MPDQLDEFDAGFETETGEAGEAAKEEDGIRAAQAPLASPPPAWPAPATAPQAARLSEVPENIREELESLRRLNPDAASLAMEDSADGASIRSRLEGYGAEMAQDRAERLLERRQSRVQEARARQAQIDAYNRNFSETLRQNAPEYFAMATDPGRAQERERYIRDVEKWIGTLPFGEGARLMEIRRRGNASQVCDLLSRYESAKGSRGAADAGAFAVASRGSFYAPAGDASDFDAGWNLGN